MADGTLYKMRGLGSPQDVEVILDLVQITVECKEGNNYRDDQVYITRYYDKLLTNSGVQLFDVEVLEVDGEKVGDEGALFKLPATITLKGTIRKS